jgi:hypothetical protein
MTKKLFEIEEYYLSPKVINVILQDEREFTIDREEFEKWLEDRGRLEYTFVNPDHTGEPKETTGTMSLSAYWGEWDAYSDLYDYIIVKNMVDPFNIESSLGSILEDYSS